MIQGTADTAVDWKKNMEFIKEKFQRADVLMGEAVGQYVINETLRSDPVYRLLYLTGRGVRL